MDSTIGIIQIEKYIGFYRWLQCRAKIKFVDDLDKIFLKKLGKFFKDNFVMGNYEKNPFIFFMDAFSNKHKKMFIVGILDDINSSDDDRLDNIIKVGYFFYKFRNEFMFRYKSVLGWSKDMAHEKLDNMPNEYVNIYLNLNRTEKEEVVGWYNQFYLFN